MPIASVLVATSAHRENTSDKFPSNFASANNTFADDGQLLAINHSLRGRKGSGRGEEMTPPPWAVSWPEAK
ncbi:hypothetical protein ZHAS_00015652 [Anopheles sinensis]|uniref:Uncharacterized protein n=1 Tax=Anopheles sinensis TaxID=74873 RepID=A0A084WB10_ANOSI|nr:hypothetical protein ZHAS_00015652 [Anopheles sinensis]